MDLRVERLTADREGDFLALMVRDSAGSECWCVAWWVPTWDAYSAHTPEQNLLVRQEVFDRGVHDGYLAYVEGAPIAWTQVGPRDRLPKIAEGLFLPPDPDVWAISCFVVLAPYRRQGVARRIVTGVLEDLRSQGVRRVEGYPRTGAGHDDGEVWTGPESLYVEAGFTKVSDGPGRVVYRLELTG